MTTAHPPLPVHDHRPGAGPTLVFLHYWGGSARTWDLVLDRLTGRDTLTVDFRGWGRSRDLPGPYTLRRFADDTLAVIADAGVTDHVLVGHSMGGKVAQLVAATRPAGLRGIVLVGPAPAKPPAHVTPGYREGLSHAYDSDESVADARDNVLTATALPEAIKSQIADDSRAAADAARAEWPLRGIAEDVTGHTRMVGVPALVVAGENDRVEPVGVLRDNLVPYLPGAELVVIPKTGHLIPLEAPADLAAAITAFAPASRPATRDGLGVQVL
ncbi:MULTISPECIES: alpha/beta fold hydrolase [Actinomadura]|uniref:Alpha/beta fold hydrolase n=1 Tax=Actinomadura yumaensis TaxID=111807 RepID=A0ABW2CKJ8_9ACTN|nr:alpha/beta hydrolase [Actinomadura sp. J1-007]MWK37098.1 alpha/beta fold hydrolase [Actinomadura sp. J1-007]